MRQVVQKKRTDESIHAKRTMMSRTMQRKDRVDNVVRVVKVIDFVMVASIVETVGSCRQ